MTGQIAELQNQHRLWLEHNFPDQLPHQPLLGLAEEVGELAHVHLKREQQIRDGRDIGHSQAVKADAIGDIFIYLMSYCTSSGINLESAILSTWRRVQARDWRTDPKAGGE